MSTHPRPQRKCIVWMWKSNTDPWLHSEPEEWCSYSDVETAIIEEAYNKKQSEALLDNYHIDFKHSLQISNINLNNQRPVKRISKYDREESSLREERFMPHAVIPSTSFNAGCSWRGRFLYALIQHYNLSHIKPLDNGATRRMMVEKAAEGISIEAKKEGKQNVGEWMAEQLTSTKKRSRQQIWKCCARLYSMESFLYKKLNEVMRLVDDGNEEHEGLWQSKVLTFGPFSLLLYELGDDNIGQSCMTVNRGANLPDAVVEQYRVAAQAFYICAFPSFTSTSRNRARAERFGNVLFVVDIRQSDGRDISSYSNYPHEEEVLLNPNFNFYIRSLVFDEIKSKWIIHLEYSKLFSSVSPDMFWL
jgi:hypothetical protein